MYLNMLSVKCCPIHSDHVLINIQQHLSQFWLKGLLKLIVSVFFSSTPFLNHLILRKLLFQISTQRTETNGM